MITELALFGRTGQTMDPDYWAPVGVTGADLVAQRLLYFLFTPTGSVPGRAADGSDFAVTATNFRSEFDIFAAFTAALPAASGSVRAAESDTDPDSEKYGSALLNTVTIAGDQVILGISVTAADGSTPATPVSVVLPT